MKSCLHCNCITLKCDLRLVFTSRSPDHLITRSQIDKRYLWIMKGDNNRPLKEWLQVFAQSPQIRTKLYQTRIEKMWMELMGPVINGYTRGLKLDDRTLMIFIESSSLKAELTIMKETIRTRVNERLGEAYVTDVRIL